jgi:hypothetical protein
MAGPDEATIVHYVRWEDRYRFVNDLRAKPAQPPHPDHPGLFPSEFLIKIPGLSGLAYPQPHPNDFGHWFHRPLHAKVEVVYRRPVREHAP